MMIGVIDSAALDPFGTPSEILLDFFNDVYTVSGLPVAVTTLLGTNSSYGPFDTGDISPGVGLLSPAEGAFIGAALTRALAGCTVLFEVTFVNVATPGVEAFLFNDPDFDEALYVEVNDSVSHVGDFDTDQTDGLLIVGPNKIGVTFSSTNVALSINGGAAVAKPNPTIGSPNALGFLFAGAGGATKVTKIAITPAVSNAELAVLTLISNLSLPAANLSLSSTAPVFFIGSSATIQPGAGNLALTSTAPTVNIESGITISPASGSLILSSFVPVVSVTSNILIVPAAANLAIVGTEPSVPSWITTFDPTLTADSDGWNGYNIREVIAAAQMLASGSKFRITFQAGAGEGTTLTNIYAGHGSGSTAFDGTQVRVTFDGGSSSKAISAGQTALSDEITYAVNETNIFIVAMHLNGGTGVDTIRHNGGSGARMYQKNTSGADETATTNPSGYAQWYDDAIVDKIEVFA